jgi:GNAT superfamily N-acetyltransferase
VSENRLSDPTRVTESSYLPHVAVGSAWVADTGYRIDGFAVLDSEASSVWALFVRHEAQGAGIGRALHDRMLAWAREQGMPQLSLSTSPGTRAELFYKEAGWLPVGLTLEGEVRFERTLVS